MNKPHLYNIGRRGLVLILCGFIWFFYGLALLNIPRTVQSRIDSTYGIATTLYHFFESSISGYPWVFCGTLAVLFGLLRSRRDFSSRDHYGFNAILLPAIVWALFYFWAWVLSVVTNDQYGLAAGLYGFLIWALFTGFILIISGWPDPGDLPSHLNRREPT